MFQKIVLPLDLSDRHHRAVEIAADMAVQGGMISLLHVIELIGGSSMQEDKDFYKRLERTARAHLEKFGKVLAERKVSWRAEVRYGNRAAECVQFVEETAADLMILTAPRLDAANPAVGWASMSYKMGILSQCPVLLVK